MPLFRRSFVHFPLALLALAGVYSCGKKSSTASSSSIVPSPTSTAPKPTKTASNTPAQPAPAPTFHFIKPEKVRGIYLTAWSAGSSSHMAKLIDAMSRTELNAVVIDVRDSGEMYWKTGIPLAKAAHAEQIGVPRPKDLMERLQKGGIYPIARIACFRDNFVPKLMPSRGVQFADGRPWHDHSGHNWLDPYNHKNWDYIVQTVEYALSQGFPEIQLDYVRFPSEGKASTQRFPGRKTYPEPKATPSDVIARFCDYVVKRVHAKGALCSADIFGIISSSKSDQGIGQTLEKIAAPFDVVSPMIYPSHFAKGEYGIPNPNASPYAIIHKSLTDYKKRVPKTTVRPWLQDFSLGVRYGVTEVQAQIKAAHDVGYDQFLLWNAGNRYTWAAVPKQKK